MRETLTGGMHVAEQVVAGASIVPVQIPTVAFVGRTLRGPVGQAVILDSYAAFERIFGGLWQPSPLSYALEHYFEHGGPRAVVVRAVNGARCATLTLPCSDVPASAAVWRLVAVNPGTREFLRVAVDYDGIGADETEEFNLLVQRLRGSAGEIVEEQEHYLRVSVAQGAPRTLAELLATSRLVRLVGVAPTLRPAATASGAYIASAPDGLDGATPTDHDLIGTAEAGTGLFALDGVDWQWLVLPPRSRNEPVGMAAWCVAAKRCAARRALLLIDAPRAWTGVTEALTGLRDWPLRTADAALVFPWLRTTDRLRGEGAEFPPTGAVAGLLARREIAHPPWRAPAATPLLLPLRQGYALSCPVLPADRARLAAWGANVPDQIRPPPGATLRWRTLMPALTPNPYLRDLLLRRRLQAISEALILATHWVLFEPAGGPVLWRRLSRQVGEFLSNHANLPATALIGQDDWFVICDGRLNPGEGRPQTVRLVFGLAGDLPGSWHAFLLTQALGGAVVRSVSLNAWSLPRAAQLFADETAVSTAYSQQPLSEVAVAAQSGPPEGLPKATIGLTTSMVGVTGSRKRLG